MELDGADASSCEWLSGDPQQSLKMLRWWLRANGRLKTDSIFVQYSQSKGYEIRKLDKDLECLKFARQKMGRTIGIGKTLNEACSNAFKALQETYDDKLNIGSLSQLKIRYAIATGKMA